ncbi:hypothetical protein Ancab_007715 [Ancistrocladus abbreviatus]
MLDVINTVLWVKIDEEVFPIRVAEEPVKVEDWSATTREASIGFCASPSSPSTSINAVPNSFGNISASKQQPSAVTSSMVVADFSKFKPEQNELANPTPIDSRPTNGMEPVKGKKFAPFQDARCKTEGADRLSKPIVVVVSKSQGWEGPELLKSTEDIQREEDSVFSLSPGPS